MGIMLYWKERFLNENENDIRKGVRFTSSDPNLIKLFLKWLKDIGKIKNEEIGFDIFASEDKRDQIKNFIDYWAEITDFPREYLSHIYFQKAGLKKVELKRKIKQINKRKIVKKAYFGLLRIRVKASSMLARQIAGWIRGIKNNI